MAKQSEIPGPETTLETTLGLTAVILGLALPLYRPWVSMGSTAFLLLWLFGGRLRERAGRLRSHRLTIAILCFIVLNISSLIWTSDAAGGFSYLTKYRYLLLVPMLATSIRPLYRRFAVNTFEIASAVSVVLSFAVIAGLLRLRDAHPGNPSPTMSHLDYGLLLALASLLILVRVLYAEKTTRGRVLWGGLAVFTVIGLLVNIGRSGHLAFVGGLLVLLVHWARNRPVSMVVAVVASIALSLMLAWFLVPSFQDRTHAAYSDIRGAIVDRQYDSNLGGRVAALRVARDLVRENPLLGTGVGGNLPALRHALDTRYPDLKPSIYWYQHFHNQYAQVATELGVVGLLGLAWIFWELIRGPYSRRETGAAALVLATVYLFGFLGEPFFRKQMTIVLFAFFAGLISADQLDADSEPADTSQE